MYNITQIRNIDEKGFGRTRTVIYVQGMDDTTPRESSRGRSVERVLRLAGPRTGLRLDDEGVPISPISGGVVHLQHVRRVDLIPCGMSNPLVSQ